MARQSPCTLLQGLMLLLRLGVLLVAPTAVTLERFVL
jgi:hypothetical protein